MIRILVMVAALLALGGFASAQGGRGEVRGFWAEGFNASIHTPEQVDTLVGRLQASNTNAIWQQFRKRGDAHYRSTYELWARENPQHFDALQYLIDKAHAARDHRLWDSARWPPVCPDTCTRPRKLPKDASDRNGKLGRLRCRG